MTPTNWNAVMGVLTLFGFIASSIVFGSKIMIRLGEILGKLTALEPVAAQVVDLDRRVSVLEDRHDSTVAGKIHPRRRHYDA